MHRAIISFILLFDFTFTVMGQEYLSAQRSALRLPNAASDNEVVDKIKKTSSNKLSFDETKLAKELGAAGLINIDLSETQSPTGKGFNEINPKVTNAIKENRLIVLDLSAQLEEKTNFTEELETIKKLETINRDFLYLSRQLAREFKEITYNSEILREFIKEMLKSAFRHGNKLGYNAKIYLYIDTKNRKIAVVNLISSKEISEVEWMAARKAELFGHGAFEWKMNPANPEKWYRSAGPRYERKDIEIGGVKLTKAEVVFNPVKRVYPGSLMVSASPLIIVFVFHFAFNSLFSAILNLGKINVGLPKFFSSVINISKSTKTISNSL
ncbi:MAG: hypothetical protein ABII74_06905 [Elusimicrobiota bacterium]